MEIKIFPLMPADFGRCGDIWDLKKAGACETVL